MATYPGIALNDPPMLLPAGTVPSRTVPSVPSLFLGFLGDYTTNPPPGGQAVLPQSTFPACCLSEWYSSFIYGRVWVIPTSYDFGILAQDASIDVEVWNALSAPITLASITQTNTEGLPLTEPVATPYQYLANTSQIYTVTATLSGPAKINGSFLFDFTTETPSLQITGMRVTPWQFRPNWREPVVERLSWKTQIIPHSDGSEQARAKRRIPRRSMDFRATIQGEDCQLFDTLLVGWQDKVYLFPLWMDDVLLTAAATSGAMSLQVEETTNLGFTDGGLALAKTPSGYVVLELDTVATDQLNLLNPLITDLSNGFKIYPARLSRIQSSQIIPKYTAQVRDALLSFDIQELYEETATDSAVLYRSIPVMEDRPNWREPLDSQVERNIHSLDNSTGIPEYTDINGVPHLTPAHRWTRSGRADVLKFRQWLHARHGRRVPTWVPTFTPDLTVADNLYIGNPLLVIKNIYYHRYLAGVPGRRHVQILLNDGTKYYRQIVSAEAGASSEVENLTLDSGLDQTVAPGNIRRVSYLQLCRFNTDTIELAWYTSRTVEVAAAFKVKTNDI